MASSIDVMNLRWDGGGLEKELRHVVNKGMNIRNWSGVPDTCPLKCTEARLFYFPTLWKT